MYQPVEAFFSSIMYYFIYLEYKDMINISSIVNEDFQAWCYLMELKF